MNMEKVYIAIDLGAGSGRVIIGCFGEERFDLEIVHRFPNEIQEVDGHLRWNTQSLFQEIKYGLKKLAAREYNLVSIGVDTWGVDYGLFDVDGNVIEEPVCYRDSRTAGVMEKVFQRIPKEEIFEKTGIQFLPLNTLYQIFAQKALNEWPAATDRLLLMPDIFHHYLSGKMLGEYTMASTTQLLNAGSKNWDAELIAALDLPIKTMPLLVRPGDNLGILRPDLRSELGLSSLKIIAPAAHDTASAVVGTPLQKGWGYVSSGTWSLVGVETTEPIINSESFRHNFTNEGGAFGTIRFLKNVMGLWILEQCREIWKGIGDLLSYDILNKELDKLSSFLGFINPEDLRFMNPRNMVDEVNDYLKTTGQQISHDQAVLSKVILDSLAMSYASVFKTIESITGEKLAGIHIIGGGSQNDYLNQATANATGLEVLAGPVEATAIGNLMVQAIADGRFSGLAEAREFIQSKSSLKRYRPQNTHF